MLFVNASLVLLVLGFEFLALVNLLVYVGALAVLFLFVIMLLNIPTSELRAFYRGKSFIALGAVSFVVARMFFALGAPCLESFPLGMGCLGPVCCLLPDHTPDKGWGTLNSINVGVFAWGTQESINAIGEAFYIRFADVLLLNSLVLTTALFGALVLVRELNISLGAGKK